MLQSALALLLQIALVAAAPIETATKDDILGYRIGGGVVGFILLALDIIVWCTSITCSQLQERQG